MGDGNSPAKSSKSTPKKQEENGEKSESPSKKSDEKASVKIGLKNIAFANTGALNIMSKDDKNATKTDKDKRKDNIDDDDELVIVEEKKGKYDDFEEDVEVLDETPAFIDPFMNAPYLDPMFGQDFQNQGLQNFGLPGGYNQFNQGGYNQFNQFDQSNQYPQFNLS